MKKADLLKFIELYNLSGTVERVKIVSDGNKLSTNFVTEDKTLYGTLVFNDIKLDAGEYGVHDTAQLVKMLNILDEEVTVRVVKTDSGVPVGLTFVDDNTESMAMLADLSVIPKAPVGVNVGKIDLELNIDEEFVDRFIRAKNALADIHTFTFVTNPKTSKVEMIIGYSNVNANRIRLEIKPVAGKDKPDKTVSFNANFLKEIFMKNRDMSGIVFRVNSSGLGHLHFKTVNYEANYYLLKVTNI